MVSTQPESPYFGAFELPCRSKPPYLQLEFIARCLNRPRLLGIAMCWLAIGPAPAQEIGKLYATRPPPGSAFIRAASIGDIKAGTKLHINARDLPIAGSDVASRYRAVRADAPIKLSIDGAAIGENITFLADRFYTVAIMREGANWTSHAIDEGQGGNASDLKAQLRFFNLVPGCEATTASGTSFLWPAGIAPASNCCGGALAALTETTTRSASPVPGLLTVSVNAFSSP